MVPEDDFASASAPLNENILEHPESQPLQVAKMFCDLLPAKPELFHYQKNAEGQIVITHQTEKYRLVKVLLGEDWSFVGLQKKGVDEKWADLPVPSEYTGNGSHQNQAFAIACKSAFEVLDTRRAKAFAERILDDLTANPGALTINLKGLKNKHVPVLTWSGDGREIAISLPFASTFAPNWSEIKMAESLPGGQTVTLPLPESYTGCLKKGRDPSVSFSKAIKAFCEGNTDLLQTLQSIRKSQTPAAIGPLKSIALYNGPALTAETPVQKQAPVALARSLCETTQPDDSGPTLGALGFAVPLQQDFSSAVAAFADRQIDLSGLTAQAQAPFENLAALVNSPNRPGIMDVIRRGRNAFVGIDKNRNMQGRFESQKKTLEELLETLLREIEQSTEEQGVFTEYVTALELTAQEALKRQKSARDGGEDGIAETLEHRGKSLRMSADTAKGAALTAQWSREHLHTATLGIQTLTFNVLPQLALAMSAEAVETQRRALSRTVRESTSLAREAAAHTARKLQNPDMDLQAALEQFPDAGERLAFLQAVTLQISQNAITALTEAAKSINAKPSSDGLPHIRPPNHW